MAATVQIGDIVDALGMQVDEMCSYVDRQTGKVYSFTSEELSAIEDSEEGEVESDFDDETLDAARRAVSMDESMVELPDDVEEWQIMKEFAEGVKDARVREDLARAIHGKGAFRYFKDTVKRHRIEKDYYNFRDVELRKIAIAWCADNDIPWE